MYYIYAFFYCKKIQKIQNIVHNLQKSDIMIMVGTYCNVSVQKREHTMKYKVLLSGRNKIIMNEFFSYMDFSFECLSCSERYDDIVNHLTYTHGQSLRLKISMVIKLRRQHDLILPAPIFKIVLLKRDIV